MLPIDLVLNPVDASWGEILDTARRAEDAGYAGLWVLDHVSAAPFGATTARECFTLLGALAVAVPHLPLGPLVVNAGARPVAVAATALETLASVLGARLRIGVGAGAGVAGPFAVEHAVLGRPAPGVTERHARVAELVAELRARSSFGGCRVLVGANSVGLAAIAGAVADGLNVGVDHPRRDELVAAARAAAGDRAFEISCWARWRPDLVDPTAPARRSLAELGARRLMLAVRPAELGAGGLPPAS